MGGMDSVKDSLTYKDLAGRRRLRRYVLAAAAILILMGGIVVWGWRQRGQLLAREADARAPARAAVRPSSEATALAGNLPAELSPTQIAVDAQQPLIQNEGLPANLEACPSDPDAWEFLPLTPGDNFQRVDPPCVYDGLARTVAWELLRVLGYSATRAADVLGFVEFPWRPVAEITGMTSTQGPMSIPLANPDAAEVRQAGHPDLHAWIVDREGRPGAVFTLRGCYQTAALEGDRLENGEVGYRVICVVAMDQGERAVLQLGSQRYASESLPTRRFALFGYAGDGLWIFLGYQREPFVELRAPNALQPAVLPLTMDLDEIEADREFTSGLHGITPWDAAWLEAAFGLAMRPLPEGWQRQGELSAYQAIQDDKAKWTEGRSP